MSILNRCVSVLSVAQIASSIETSSYELFLVDTKENCVSTCVCCSVPCPISGVNKLTVGGGA